MYAEDKDFAWNKQLETAQNFNSSEYLQNNFAGYMSERYVLYGVWLIGSWLGIPMLSLNLQIFNDLSLKGSNLYYGMLLSGILGGNLWAFGLWIYFFLDSYKQVEAAYYTIQGYSEKSLFDIEIESRKRL